MRSAALRVTGPEGIDRCDLRIDWAEEAVAALRALLTAYGGQADGLRRLALTPGDVPVQRKMFETSVTRIAELGLEERIPTARSGERWRLRD